MISEKDEYKRLISHRLEENRKSFQILFEMRHYGNCISIMCQELDQVFSLLFLLNRVAFEKDKLMSQSINSQKWSLARPGEKKEYITEKEIAVFAESLVGWEKSIYEFGLSFRSLSKNYNYLLRDPIRGMSDVERRQIAKYIVEYHDKAFPADFTIAELVPMLEAIFEKVTGSLVSYMSKL